MTSELRDLHTTTTRMTILRAAFELFREHGFADTTVRGIAERAGVAVQTIYSQFGSKAGVAAGLAELVEAEAGLGPLFAAWSEADEPLALVDAFARIERTLEERAGGILGVIRRAAASDAGIAEAVAFGESRRRASIEATVGRLAEMGALRDGLDVVDAADVVEALVAGLHRPRPTGPDVVRPPDEHERLLRESLRWYLLGR